MDRKDGEMEMARAWQGRVATLKFLNEALGQWPIRYLSHVQDHRRGAFMGIYDNRALCCVLCVLLLFFQVKSSSYSPHKLKAAPLVCCVCFFFFPFFLLCI